MYRALGNAILSSFLTMQFFPPSQKITIKIFSFIFLNRNKIFFAAVVKNDFTMCVSCFMKTFLLVLHVHQNWAE